MPRTNAFDQPIGDPLPDWTPRPRPPHEPMAGRFCRLEPLAAASHAAPLFEAYALDRDGRNWTYLPYGPFETVAAYTRWVEWAEAQEDPQFYAILDAEARPVGVASFLRMDPTMGVIEVGHLSFSPRLQRTPAATEAMFLMMRRVFAELGYRRYEWKCDALNAPSRRAAGRLGFRFEGIFRQMFVVKGRNRDTAWYSILDSEWPALAAAFEAWLAPENFDADGRQHHALATPRG